MSKIVVKTCNLIRNAALQCLDRFPLRKISMGSDRIGTKLNPRMGFWYQLFCFSLNLWSATRMIKSWSIVLSGGVDNTRWKKVQSDLVRCLFSWVETSFNAFKFITLMAYLPRFNLGGNLCYWSLPADWSYSREELCSRLVSSLGLWLVFCTGEKRYVGHLVLAGPSRRGWRSGVSH